MKVLVFTSIMFCTFIMYGQEVKLSFNPILTGDSVKIELVIKGDNSLELGSSNFVYTVDGEALDVSSATDVMPLYSPESYSIWSYVHHKDFEHILLSRTYQPKSLLKIDEIGIGEVSYLILDKCNPVSLNWITKKGDIRSFKKSIKKEVNFVDTTFLLVKPVLAPIVTEDEYSKYLILTNENNHTVKWYKDDVFISEGNEVKTNETGVYYATVTNGCETKTTESYRVDQITSTNEQHVATATTLYPNPVVEKFTLSIDETNLSKVTKVTLINEVGKELKELTSFVQSSKTKFDVATWNLPEGIYFVKILYQEESEIIRFVY